ncbi:MAG TPA: ATP-binding cassette domain-containing protein, partial [Propionicimonas sp.]|nr:ATP-binding cassette domain-containing protein [Propionicimonas sp.]
ITPPLAALARAVGWTEVPLSVREARRRALAEGLLPTPPTPPLTETAPVVLRATDVEVRFGDVTAVHGVDLELRAGSVKALMGRNGAGKSSLLWALQGALTCAGRIEIAGIDPRGLGAAKARRLVTLVPQTAADLLYLATVGAECDQADRESEAPPGTTAGLLAELGIQLPPDRDPRDLSEGQRLALVLAIQLAAKPRVLLLDEPTRGLDYRSKADLHRIVDRLAARGMAVLISTHDVEFAALASRGTLLMADGELIAQGRTADLLTSSPAYAPQMSKVFAPIPVLTPDDVARGLR